MFICKCSDKKPIFVIVFVSIFVFVFVFVFVFQIIFWLVFGMTPRFGRGGYVWQVLRQEANLFHCLCLLHCLSHCLLVGFGDDPSIWQRWIWICVAGAYTRSRSRRFQIRTSLTHSGWGVEPFQEVHPPTQLPLLQE